MTFPTAKKNTTLGENIKIARVKASQAGPCIGNYLKKFRLSGLLTSSGWVSLSLDFSFCLVVSFASPDPRILCGIQNKQSNSIHQQNFEPSFLLHFSKKIKNSKK